MLHFHLALESGSWAVVSPRGVSGVRDRDPACALARVCVGSLHESFVHECLKSSLAFRKPATAAASRRPARADGPKVGLDGHASLSAGRAPWRDGQAFLPLRRRPEGKVCRRAEH